MRSYHVLLAAALVAGCVESTEAQSGSQQLDILGPAVEKETPRPPVQIDVDGLATSRETSSGPPAGFSSSSGDDFAQRMWNYLKHGPVAYDEWRAFPGQPESLQVGHSPHGSRVRLVANRKARSSSGAPVHGSILLKENYNSTGTRLTSITLMYRSLGYNSTHNDWFWAKYRPDGTLAKVNGRPGAGRISSCIECHQTAGGGDYVFAND